MNGFNLSNISDLYVGGTQASAAYYGSNLIWSAVPPQHDYSQDYFTIESLEDNNTIYFKAGGSTSAGKTIQYSINKTNWTSAASTTSSGTTLTTLNTGDKLYLRGSETQYTVNNLNYFNRFDSDKNINVYGNIMSLIYEDNFVGQDTLSSPLTFCRLFYQNTKLIDASNLIMPAMTLTAHCYRGMFSGCTSLTTAPVLPAITLATTCYNAMFSGCTSLNYIKAMFTTTPGAAYTTDWVSNVSATGTFVKNSEATWTNTGKNAVPNGWTVQTASA